MKKVLQSLRNGKTYLADLPSPIPSEGELLISSLYSLISPGTEKMLINFGKDNWFIRAKNNPEKVKQVIEKIKVDGIQTALKSVANKLDEPISLGYCNVGRVIGLGQNVSDFKIGDIVVSNGSHSELNCVPTKLCAKIPAKVKSEDAVFTVIASISLQSVRLLNPTLGESIAVFGLGLVGLITVQLLKANGCRVIGIDFDKERLALAEKFGAETFHLKKDASPVKAAMSFSRSVGVDGVIIATNTKSNDPVLQAADMSRKNGRIILVGVCGLELAREKFYEKEILFRVSSSYGPGRYDPNYEIEGNDYPIGYVRWTEQRNFEAIIEMLSEGQINFSRMLTHEIEFKNVGEAYNTLFQDKSSLGILIKYQDEVTHEFQTQINFSTFDERVGINDQLSLSVIGAGNYSSGSLTPAFKKAGVRLIGIASSKGINSTVLAKKYGFLKSTTDADSLINDENTNVIAIATRHNTHCHFLLKALKARKHVFLEKPLCLNSKELSKIIKLYKKTSLNKEELPLLMIGFNRRFSPHIIKIKELLENNHTPKSFLLTVNAGPIDKSHWVQNRAIGGGRVIGEVCHFVDLLKYLSGSKIRNVSSVFMDSDTGDTLSINISFDDGSIGTICYFANGNRKFKKERLEVFSENGILQLDNYQKLEGYNWPSFRKMNLWKQDKGNVNCVANFVNAIKNGLASPISFDDIVEVTKVCIEIEENLSFGID